MIFSKFPIEQAEDFNWAGNQAGLRVDFTAYDQSVSLFGIHPYSPKDNRYMKLRNDYYRQLDSRILENSSDHTIVLGDFNISPWNVEFLRFVTASDLKPSLSYQGSFPSMLGFLGVDIDHILVSQNILSSIKKYHSIPGSDHLGVSAKIKFIR